MISFKGGFHGRLFGSLSTTRSKAIHKLDIPAFDWPACPFPALKYPLSENEQANKDEEARCLQVVDETITEWEQKGKPVAALIVEPIQSEGGDFHASPSFFRGLREITKERGVFFICDEVQTGVGATGAFWAHEKWGLGSDNPPDFVTYSKKAQASGFFHRLDTRATAAYRQYNTWMGDPIRALQAREMIKIIERDGLVENTKKVGEYLYSKLESLQSGAAHGKISNLRGKGWVYKSANSSEFTDGIFETSEKEHSSHLTARHPPSATPSSRKCVSRASIWAAAETGRSA